jgi:sigma-B regulation protein RsbU (phosphoserine phosphatase)
MLELAMAEKILVVEDRMADRKLLVGMLQKEGYEIIEVADGDEAVQLALTEQPDLIILDIVMPKRDGYEVCVELKRDGRCAHIPIIFCSARTEAEDKIRGLELGGGDYVTKPFDKGEVLARVRAHLKIRRLTKALIQANKELMDKQESLNEDLKAASGIQRCLLPPGPPDAEALDVAWRFMPCRSVGGDIFNIFRLDETSWGLYMLDVSGHGVPSALVAVSVSQMLQPQVGFLLKRSTHFPPYYEVLSPSDVLAELNRSYPFERFHKFFTMSYLILNTRESSIKYSNAAHPPPLLLRKDGVVELLEEGGTVIGMGAMKPYREGMRRLAPGDKLIVYTDGILEYQNNDGELYGKDRFLAELKRFSDRPVFHMVNEAIGALLEFGGNTEPRDDVSLLGLEFRGEGR